MGKSKKKKSKSGRSKRSVIKRIRPLGAPGGDPIMLADDRDDQDRIKAERSKRVATAVLPLGEPSEDEQPKD
jgi:hypothetical protein